MTKTTDDQPNLPLALTDGALATLAPASSSAYFFDVDGTLLDIKSQPGDVVADPALRDILTTLQDKVGGALALVSGRTIQDIDRIFAPLRFAAAGTHGAMLRFSDGLMAGVTSEPFREVSGLIEAFVAANPGLLFENKGAALTVHFRHAPEMRPAVLALLADCIQENNFVILEGKMVAELKLAQFNKGTALESFMERAPFLGRKPVFVGDDVTDEYGFAYVNKMDGLSIRVDRTESATNARFRLLDPAALRAQLTAILSAV